MKYDIPQLLTEMDVHEINYVKAVDQERHQRAEKLRDMKERKIKGYVTQLIEQQLEKLEAKLSFLEELEKSTWNERAQLEVLQKIGLAERANLTHKKNEVLKSLHHNSWTTGTGSVGKIPEHTETYIITRQPLRLEAASHGHGHGQFQSNYMN